MVAWRSSRRGLFSTKVGLAPIDDVVVIVAARDRAAHHQEQHLAQRIHEPRILDLREVIEQRGEARARRKG
jgi:hypothetical protein